MTDACHWCGGTFYGPKVPLFSIGNRVKVKPGCVIAGRPSIRAGHAGIVVAVDPATTKSRYQIRFGNGWECNDWWSDRDLDPA